MLSSSNRTHASVRSLPWLAVVWLLLDERRHRLDVAIRGVIEAAVYPESAG
jgi:hypothetical protein